MSTIVPQELTTGVFTQSDENSLENKLILVFGTPEKLEKKELLAQDCYSRALQNCTSYGFLYIISNYGNASTNLQEQYTTDATAQPESRILSLDVHFLSESIFATVT